MSTNTSIDTESSSALVADLLEQRTRIQSWLDNLDTVSSEAKAQVVERVRSDYSQRLEIILDELAKHLESIRSDQVRRAEELTAATRRLDEATEELEEARLRHMIGEISEDEWKERQPALTDAVSGAEADREDAAAEVQRLDELLRQIQADGETAAPTAPPLEGPDDDEAAVEFAESFMDLDDAGTIDAPHEEPSQAEEAGEVPIHLESGSVDEEDGPEEEREGDQDLMILHSPDPLAFLSDLPGSEDETTVEQPVQTLSDLDFLRDLDRAIGGGEDGAESPAGAGIPDEDPEQYRPTPGTKCPECGYTNDPEAWYCGVCGVDLA